VHVYLREKVPQLRNKDFALATAAPINEWWGRKTLADVRGQSCRDYVEWRTKQTGRHGRRVSESTARHDLKTLRAAIYYYNGEYGPLPSLPKVTMPEQAPAKERWLTRQEAARFVKAAYRLGSWHVLRFLLIGLYTATRKGALLSLRWLPSTNGGWIDIEHGLIYRSARGEAQTKKRKPPVRIPAKLLPWLKRWKAEDERHGWTHVIHWDGVGIDQMRRSFGTVRKAAGLGPDVTPHTLRHTAITWQLQAGVDHWTVAGWAGLTVEMIDRVYGHHAQSYQRKLA